MKKHIIKWLFKANSLISCCLFASMLYAQADNPGCNCCSAPYRQFDFWLGDWNVYDTSGKKIGENKIVLMQDSCLLQENWTSMGQHRGTSYNYFNKTDSTWNQVWIANNGNILELKGNRSGNKMVLKSALVKADKGGYYYNRISWEQMPDGSVIQQWDILDNKDNNLSAVFKGIYRKK